MSSSTSTNPQALSLSPHRGKGSHPNPMNYEPDQLLLALTQTVTEPRRCSLVCIPDLDSAQCERTRVQHEHGANLIKVDIRKDKPTKRGSSTHRTYTLSYTLLETRTERMF